MLERYDAGRSGKLKIDGFFSLVGSTQSLPSHRMSPSIESPIPPRDLQI